MLFAFFVTTIVTSCSKSGDPTGGGVTSVTITSFSFQQAGNSIPVASTGAIAGNNINVFLPPGTSATSLIASFTLSAPATVTVNGVLQQSNTTANDFSKPVTYTIAAPGSSPVSYTVNLITSIAAIDQGVAVFMSKYNVPGLSIAITLNEQLVYLNSYGKASLEDNQNTTIKSLFRISSLSKPITSAAIMRLLDQGRINLDQNVFGPNGILGTSYGSQPYGPGIANITVRELLHHTEGGWPDDSTDPFGQNLNLSPQNIVGWGLDNVPLQDTIPGRSFYYSHFGYVVLGRVIEKITGVPYEQAVQNLILQPSGIADMQIGHNTLAARLPNEVRYYNGTGVNPYVMNISQQDAANGWVASAADMAKFMVNVDGLSGKTILTKTAINAMTAGSDANSKYACGWEINSLNWWHDGRLPGTGTTMAITTQLGNFNYIILANTSNADPNFTADEQNIFWNNVPAVTAWPTYDLFSTGLVK
jgi:CubicO group peptidase (beta-lactamase class C family)